MNSKILQVRIPESTIIYIDKMISQGHLKTRSEFIRFCILKCLENDKNFPSVDLEALKAYNFVMSGKS